MSTLAADVAFDFSFPCDPSTPPSFTFDPSLLEIPYNPGHARSSSHGSVYSFESSPSDSYMSTSTRHTTPARSPIRQHGPLLLPKIRSQDQALPQQGPAAPAAPQRKRMRTSPAPPPAKRSTYRPSHARSYTNPETIAFSSALTYTSHLSDDSVVSTPKLLCSPVNFAEPQDGFDGTHCRRASSCTLDDFTIEKYGCATYNGMPTYISACSAAPISDPGSVPQAALIQENFMYAPYAPRAPSPLSETTSMSATPEPTPVTDMLTYLTASNPAPSLVRTISFPLRDPHTKHFWWDVRQVRSWSAFSAANLLSLPGASDLLSCPVPAALLPEPIPSSRHPENEASLHGIYASYYLPKLNAALALSSTRPLQLSMPAKNPHSTSSATECLFLANAVGESATAATIFGGKPTARVVGLVRSYDRFNTGMRVESNVKRVEYLRGLAHLHHTMREHGCRYGFILTEIELVLVRNGAEGTPHFGYLEVANVQLNVAAGSDKDRGGEGKEEEEEVRMTACLALWGLCMLAGDEPLQGHALYKSEIGAPAEGTRRKALPKDDWMPQPQLAEKREAKRARGWVWPEDPVGRKELGKRGIKYGRGC